MAPTFQIDFIRPMLTFASRVVDETRIPSVIGSVVCCSSRASDTRNQFLRLQHGNRLLLTSLAALQLPGPVLHEDER